MEIGKRRRDLGIIDLSLTIRKVAVEGSEEFLLEALFEAQISLQSGLGG